MTEANNNAVISTRWKPTRCGLVNLFRYDDETFHFSDGRLLLRGNNGTGKTRIMALTLPFLLDGSTHPSRVEPDGNRNRRIEWHLLMDKYHERTGYTWLEFKRIDEQGQELTCTLACGMKAQQGKQGLHSHWFFISPQTIGTDLPLKREDRTPWSKAECKEALQKGGQMYERVEDYRRAVDENLFGLGEHRYRNLVDLLIELRHPQLSRELNEERLTSALSDALPPLDSRVLDDVADGYRSLEEDRLGLEAVQAMKHAVDTFSQSYKDYLHVRVRQLCDDVRQRQNRYEKAQGDVRQAQEQVEKAEIELQRLNSERRQIEQDLESLYGEERALQASDTMRSAERIESLRLERERCERQQQQTQADLSEAQRVHHERASALQTRQQALAQAKEHSLDAQRQTLKLATAIGSDTEVERVGMEPDSAGWNRLLSDLESRQRSEKLLRQLRQSFMEAEQKLQLAQERVSESEAERDQALNMVDQAERETHAASEQLSSDIEEHRHQLQVLKLEPQDDGEAMLEWSREPQGPLPYRQLLEKALSRSLQEGSLQAGTLELKHRELKQQQSELIAERTELLEGIDPVSTPSVWRNSKPQHSQGAPLWAVCDFKDHVTPQRRAALEASLQSSQLLDAWIFPREHDENLQLGELSLRPQGPVPERNLLELMVPTPTLESKLSESDVADVLSRIAHDGNDAVRVHDDGSWHLGPLQGRWLKENAEHIGAASREAARKTRLEAIEVSLKTLDESLQTVQQEMLQLQSLRRQAQAEYDEAPDGEILREAWRQRKNRLQQLEQAQQRLSQRQGQRIESKERRDTQRTAFHQGAEDCGMKNWIEQLDELGPALNHYGSQLKEWRHHRERCASEAQRCQEGETLLLEARQRANEVQKRGQQMDDLVLGLQRELSTLEENMGKAVQELLQKLSSVRTELRERRERDKHLETEQRDAIDSRGRGRGALDQAQGTLEECELTRRNALAKLEEVAKDHLLAGLGKAWRSPLEHPASDTKVLELARQLHRELGDVEFSERKIDRISTRMAEANQQLQSSLSAHDVRPVIEERHGIWEVKVPFGGRDCDIAELSEGLDLEIATRHSTLTAKEREVIENFLIDEACDHIHGLLHESEEWVSQINAELAERPMSTGLTLRFRWQLDAEAPEGATEARQRLLTPLHQWSGADRETLASFLQRCIDIAREVKPGHSWQDQLGYALDYRRWHRFIIERQQDGRWTRLTKRSHGTGSGGEKAIALTIPQFAAAAAHYRAAPNAPRLIMLDEAFVGIDNDMRRHCMGLLSSFDLDVVMTSEREWGCYDTVPGLSIYQLAADRTGECIATTRYVWNGSERQRDEETK